MKKLLFIGAVAVFGFTSVNAQEEESTFGFGEGDIFIEGSVGFASEKDKNTDTKSNNVLVSPKAGYFLSDDLAVGVSLGLNTYKAETGTTITSDESAFVGGAFARYYFLDLGKRFKTYSEFGIGFGTAKNKISDTKLNTFGAGLDLGINYFVTEKIALTFGLRNVLSFSSSKYDDAGAEAVSEFNLGFGDVANPFGGNAQFGLLFKF